MSSALSVPTKYRNVPAFEQLRDRAQSLSRRNGELNKRVKHSVTTFESVGFTMLGAALHGVAQGKFQLQDGTIGIIGGGLAAFGVAFGQPSAVEVATGILAPMVSNMARTWSQNSLAGLPAGG